MMIIVEAWAKWTEDTQIQSVRLVVEIVTIEIKALLELWSFLIQNLQTMIECDMFKIVSKYGSLPQVYYQEE